MTTDGGATWTTETNVPPSAPGYEEISDQLNAIACVTSTDCIAVGLAFDAGIPPFPDPVNFVQQAVIETSIDGGQSWQGQLGPVGAQSLYCCSPTSSDDLQGISCPTAQVCLAVSSNSAFQIARTDPESSWTMSEPGVTLGDERPYAQAISCPTVLRCVAVGESQGADEYDTPVVSTSDGGVTWSSQATDPGDASLAGVACVSSSECWAVGSTPRGSLILATVNGGVATPTVTGISPDKGSAAGGDTVTIAGSGFDTGVSAVDFGSTAASDVTVDSDSKMTVTAPPSANPVAAGSTATVDVTVTTSLGTSPLDPDDQFTYVGAPAVTPDGAAAVVTSASSSAAATVKPGSPGDLLVAYIGTYNGATVNVSGGGLSWTNVFQVADSVSGDGGLISVWEAREPASYPPTPVTVSSAITGNGEWAQSLYVVAYSGATGVDTPVSGPPGFANGSASTNPSLTITPIESGSLIGIVGFDPDSVTTVIPGADQVLDASAPDTVENTQMWFQHDSLGSVAGQAITLGDTLSPPGKWDLGAVEVLPQTSPG